MGKQKFLSVGVILALTLVLGMGGVAAENLELKFDFGNDAVEPGWTGVTSGTVYSATLGYGFNASSPGFDAIWEGSKTWSMGYWGDLLGDLVGGYAPAGGNRTFMVDLPPGSYDIEIHTQGYIDTRDFRILAEGDILDESVIVGPYEYVTVTYPGVAVTDGMLDLTFDGKQNFWLIAAVRIVSNPNPPPVAEAVFVTPTEVNLSKQHFKITIHVIDSSGNLDATEGASAQVVIGGSNGELEAVDAWLGDVESDGYAIQVRIPDETTAYNDGTIDIELISIDYEPILMADGSAVLVTKDVKVLDRQGNTDHGKAWWK